MVRSTFRRILPLLVLCVLLATPGISTAAPRAGSPATPSVGNLLGWLQSTLASLWSKNGCQLDPHGNCVTSSAISTAKAGCRLDPFGRCLDGVTTAPTTGAGCEVDPNGRCRN
jgi:hypothetical protein